jgi:subtilisin family serine protease
MYPRLSPLGSVLVALVGLGLAACSDMGTAPSPPDQPSLGVKGGGGGGGKQYVIAASDTGAVPGGLAAALSAVAGTVTSVLPEIGIVIATSADPQFAAKAAAIQGVESVAVDRMVQWSEPAVAAEAVAESEAIPVELAVAEVPGGSDETFFPVQWAPVAISAPQAWAVPAEAWAVGALGKDVRVAILDGGIHNKHIDLNSNFVVAQSVSFVPGQPYNADVGTFWHGTHVAGIVAAADNGIGTIGIAPKTALIGVKVLHNGLGAFSGVISGIYYASTPVAEGGAGADIINMSLGAVASRKDKDDKELMKALDRATRYAHKRGVTLIAAAGNSAQNLDEHDVMLVPAESKYVLAISATTPVDFAHGAAYYDSTASYTNFGKKAIDFAAPGGDSRMFAPPPNPNSVCSYIDAKGAKRMPACWTLDNVVAPCRGGVSAAGVQSTTSYCWAKGTSMAAAAATGVAALIIGRYGRIGADAVEAVMRASSDDLGPPGKDPFYGVGRLNAYRAVTGNWYDDLAEDDDDPSEEPRD